MLAVPPTATVIHVKLSLTTADLRQTMENLDILLKNKQTNKPPTTTTKKNTLKKPNPLLKRANKLIVTWITHVDLIDLP